MGRDRCTEWVDRLFPIPLIRSCRKRGLCQPFYLCLFVCATLQIRALYYSRFSIMYL